MKFDFKLGVKSGIRKFGNFDIGRTIWTDMLVGEEEKCLSDLTNGRININQGVLDCNLNSPSTYVIIQ